MRFSGGPEIDFPKQQLALQISCLFSFTPSSSLAECRLCLIPTSPSPSCQYSPGEAGIAWVVQLEPDPGSVSRFLSPGLEPAEAAAVRPRGELVEEQRLLQDFTGPWIGH